MGKYTLAWISDDNYPNLNVQRPRYKTNNATSIIPRTRDDSSYLCTFAAKFRRPVRALLQIVSTDRWS